VHKSGWRTIALILGGTILGTICGQLFVHQVPLLARHTDISWNPSADLSFIRYSLNLTIRMNLLSVVGAVFGYYLARRMK
jgi:hypothetical protein